MSAFLQYKYVTQVLDILDKAKKTGNNLYNFRCPFCGDSEKNQNKRRGYLIQKDGEFHFYCHNCGISKSFSSFLYEVSPELSKQYRKELAFEHLGVRKERESSEDLAKLCSKQSRRIQKSNKYLISLDKLTDDHPARTYLESRRVPKERYSRVSYCSDFRNLIKDTFGESKYDPRQLPETGIVFELRDLTNPDSLIGYQIRSINSNVPKSKRFKICKEDNIPGVFGIDRILPGKQIYVTEGPIDSLFLPNCIAVFGASLWRAGIQDAIYINDCEPRNLNVVKQIKSTIEKGYKTVLLPHRYEGLDINDIVCQNKLSETEILDLINRYAFSGLRARIEFSNWSRV